MNWYTTLYTIACVNNRNSVAIIDAFDGLLRLSRTHGKEFWRSAHIKVCYDVGVRVYTRIYKPNLCDTGGHATGTMR